jgi:hypothetical protein
MYEVLLETALFVLIQDAHFNFHVNNVSVFDLI